jgi:hypothetical protein
MKVLIAGPPKTGNVWIEAILTDIYGLEIIHPPYIPWDALSLREFVKMGLFRQNTIFHQHFEYEPMVLEAAERTGASIVTPIRNPYDTFVSLYHYMQRFDDSFGREWVAEMVIANRPIDDPVVIDFIGTGFRKHIEMAVQWIESGRSAVVRYERLHSDPVTTVRAVTDALGPVDDASIEAAIENNRADAMRGRDELYARHIRVGRTGDWQNHLNEQHLLAFRRGLGDLIGRLGYEVV